MSNYDDVLRSADGKNALNFLTLTSGQLGCDWNADPTREEAFKLWNVSFSAAPKQNVVSTTFLCQNIQKCLLDLQLSNPFLDCRPHLDQGKRMERKCIC